MKKVFILILVFVFQIVGAQLYAQYSPCGGGDNNQNNNGGGQTDDDSSGEADVDVVTPIDPNEIIGTRGYDALGDTLQWVAATASLPYTIYFENDPELATAAAQKVEIRLANYSIMN